MSGKSKKKTPATTSRRRVTASALARISTKKAKRADDLEESYIVQGQTVSSTVMGTDKVPASSTESTILSYLQRMEQSNTELMKHVNQLEQKQSFHNGQSHTADVNTNWAPLTSQQVQFPDVHHQTRLAAAASTPNTIRVHIDVLPETNPSSTYNPTMLLPMPDATRGGDDRQKDTFFPDLNALRQNQTVSQAVAQLVASYEHQARMDLSQGRQNSVKRSGRYNTTDVITAPPHLRWANVGFHAGNGRKRVTYDDLTLPQWVVGQLMNIHQMQDMVTLKHALMQVILAAKDATSLPWSTVRPAWATSMHQVEQGSLSWADTTQWAINSLTGSHGECEYGNSKPTEVKDMQVLQ